MVSKAAEKASKQRSSVSRLRAESAFILLFKDHIIQRMLITFITYVSPNYLLFQTGYVFSYN